jgi:predicted esterase
MMRGLFGMGAAALLSVYGCASDAGSSGGTPTVLGPTGLGAAGASQFGQPGGAMSGLGRSGLGGSVAAAPMAPVKSGAAGAAGIASTAPVTPMGTAGMRGGIATGATAGSGAAGRAGGAAGSSMPGKMAPKGAMDPVIPPVMGECPNLDVPSTITFMGITGLIIDIGPKPASPTAPMLVYWHGTGLPNSEYTFMAAQVAAGITGAGGVIVSGDGTTGGDLLSGDLVWGMGDIAVMDQLVACAVKNHNVDPRQIYTMGCSAGGLMAVSYATLRSSYVAAAAPNSGGWVVPLTFDSAHTPALMTVHGTAGVDVVAIDFASTSATADDGFKQHGGFVIDCDTGGGHCGGTGLAGDAWTFFQAHTFGADAWMGTMPPGFGGGVCTPK